MNPLLAGGAVLAVAALLYLTRPQQAVAGSPDAQTQQLSPDQASSDGGGAASSPMALPLAGRPMLGYSPPAPYGYASDVSAADAGAALGYVSTDAGSTTTTVPSGQGNTATLDTSTGTITDTSTGNEIGYAYTSPTTDATVLQYGGPGGYSIGDGSVGTQALYGSTGYYDRPAAPASGSFDATSSPAAEPAAGPAPQGTATTGGGTLVGSLAGGGYGSNQAI